MEFQNISQSQKGQFLEEINIDVNTVLNFSINIDNLKLLLTSLIKNQSTLSQKIFDLENKIKERRSRGNSFRDKSSRHNYMSKSPSSESIIKLDKEEKEEKKSGVIEESEKKENIKEKEIANGSENSNLKNNEDKENKKELNDDKENVEENGDKNLSLEKKESNKENEVMECIKEETEEKNIENDDNENIYASINSTKIFDLENKMSSIEKKIKNLELLNKVNKFTGKGDDNSDEFQLMKIEFKELKDSNKKLLQENLDMKKQIENINVKLADINIYDLFKDLNASDGSIDVAKGLIINLENKVFKKIGFMDERDKKLNQDMMELKTNIQNVINKNGVICHNMDNIKNNFKELGDLVGANSTDTSNMINNLETKINDLYKEIIFKFDEEKNNTDLNIKKLNDKFTNLEILNKENSNSNETKKNNNAEFSEENLEFMENTNNKINVIEAKISLLKEKAINYTTKDDLIKIEKDLLKKANMKEFLELKDKYNLQLAKISNLEENTERLHDLNEKNGSDLIFQMKRLESITSNIISLRSKVEDVEKREKEKIIDLSKYLDKFSFGKYLKSLQPEKMKIEANFEELRNLINNMSNSLTNKCNAEDLKLFEDIMHNKFEEFKLINTRKFADKIETNRSMKYLDSQIRHIIDVYIKRMDKNDSWLIAKKPIGGFSCASCESYIGDLKNKESYMPWNKYPQREKDQNYRVGNGFSRMLNMLNIELKNNENLNEKEFDSDEEVKKYFDENRVKIRIKNSASSKNIKEKMNKVNNSAMIKNNGSNLMSNATSKNTGTNILPKINIKNEDNSAIYPLSPNLNELDKKKNFEETNNEENENIESKESNEAPHIIKIFKKTRINANLPENAKTERIYTYDKK